MARADADTPMSAAIVRTSATTDRACSLGRRPASLPSDRSLSWDALWLRFDFAQPERAE